MAYDAPTRSEMTEVILRALRDESASVFPTTTVADFINEALSDLSIYRPVELATTLAYTPGMTDLSDESFTGVWRVQLAYIAGSQKRATIIPYADPNNGRAGWNFYDGRVFVSPLWMSKAAAFDNLYGGSAEWNVYGYADRRMPTSDSSVLDLRDATDYACVLAHCKSLGFELLTHDRSLYQQWLAATNNTDVSPTQLSGMANMSDANFQRQRARNTKLRRIPGEYSYTY